MPFDWEADQHAEPPNYLWLTWIDPYPEQDGQRTYSGRLIESVAATGCRVDVLCFESEAGPRAPSCGGRVTWRTVPRTRKPDWTSVLSTLPNVAFRCATREMTAALRHLLAERPWHTIVLDGLSAGWAEALLRSLGAREGRAPRIVHISHNHEENTRAAIARDYVGNPLARLAHHGDARKTARLERKLIDMADLVTAITPEDGALFRRHAPGKPVIVLPPGYAGRRVAARTITAEVPRVVVMVGSFEWVAKRMNVEAFVSAADPVFAAAGVRLRIVGKGPPDLIEKLRRQTSATEFLGVVPDIEPHVSDARIAVVPERTGGGFKLKVLDYVFHRLPVMAMTGSLAGVPLRDPETARTFDDFDALARGIVAAIDDFPLLNRLQNGAYSVCQDHFDWRRRGEQFVSETATI